MSEVCEANPGCVELEISRNKIQEYGPIRTGCVTSGMLPEFDGAVSGRRSVRRKRGGAQSLFSEQPVNRSCTDSSEKRAFGINPRIIDIGRLLFDRTTTSLESWIARLHQLDRTVRIQLGAV